MKRILISLSPNTQKDDIRLALKTLFSPWSWYDTKFVKELESNFLKHFGKGHFALSVNSGRSAQYLILKALGVGKGDEVVIQAFTCLAVPNSIIWNGATPDYVDIDETYNIDIQDLQKKITDKTKAIIVQHTFGIPANLDKILEIAKSKNLVVIEDCAHALGAKHKNQLVGTKSTAAFFSFGRDKVISSVFGGMILTKDKTLFHKLEDLIKDIGNSPPIWIKQQLLHPILFNMLILPTYNLGFGKYSIGKILIYVLQKLKFLSKPVYRKEIKGGKPKYFPQKMSGALAILANNQLKKLNSFNTKRKEIARYYFDSLDRKKVKFMRNFDEGAIWLRFPIQIEDSKSLYNSLKEEGVLLGNWYRNVIDPKCNLDSFYYKNGMAPIAQKYAKNTVNLPTYPNMEMSDVVYLVEKINSWKNTQ